jgi:hypothetical protein
MASEPDPRRAASVTKADARALEKQTQRWQRLAGLVNKLLLGESN